MWTAARRASKSGCARTANARCTAMPPHKDAAPFRRRRSARKPSSPRLNVSRG
jgi:hypothetical protein